MLSKISSAASPLTTR